MAGLGDCRPLATCRRRRRIA